MPFSEHRCLSKHCCAKREMNHPWFLLLPFIVSGIRWAEISVSVTEHLSTICSFLQIVVNCKKNNLKIWVMILFIRAFFYLCHLDEERLHIPQNGLLFCQRQMSVKSCIGMIEYVLRQQGVQPVGVAKLKVRETLKAERVLIQTPLCLFLKSLLLLLLVVYLIVWPQVTHSLYDTFLKVCGCFSLGKHHTVLILCLSRQRN